MPNIVRLPYSNTASNTPSSLGNGVLAINQADGKLFYRNSSGVVTQLATGGGGGGGGGLAAYAATSNLPATGSDTTLYVITSTNRIYRWVSSDSVYAEVGAIGGVLEDGGSF